MPLDDIIPPDAPTLVDAVTLAGWLGVSRWTIYDWVDTGWLPRPLRICPRKLMFETAAVRQVVGRRLGEADAGPAISPAVPSRGEDRRSEAEGEGEGEGAGEPCLQN